MNYRLLFLIVFLTSVYFVNAAINIESSAKGQITGTIVDNETQNPIEYATIALYSEKDSSVFSGSVANGVGQFNISKIPRGKYVLEVSFIGYESKKQSIEISKGREDIQLGNISLSTDVSELEEVEVTAERSTIEQKIDRKVINVGKDLTTAGANALAVLAQVPSIDVNEQEATISMRGNENVKILIDGKPTHIDAAQLLRQLPSTSIKTIELITNPSAKYNPEGMSGIINITLKKEANLGFNSTLNFGYTYGDNGRYNSSIDMNYRKGKFNFFVNAGVNWGERYNHGYVFRRDNQSDQQFTFTNDYQSFLGKIGFDYYIDEKNTLSLYTNHRIWEGDFTGKTVVDYRLPVNNNLDLSQNADQKIDIYTQVYNGNLKHNFDKEGHYIEFEANFAKTTNDDDSQYDFIGMNTPSDYKDVVERNHKSQTYNIDYTNPLTDKTKLELGLESRIRKTENSYETTSTSLSESEYSYDRFIHSFYTTISHKLEKITFQAGARLEFYDVEAIQNNLLIYEDDYITIYPSAFLSYKLNDKNKLQFSYSRRVDRPSLRQVNPIREWSTPTVSSFGNPELNPQFTNSFEINYSHQTDKGSFTAGIFYRRISDEISRTISIDKDDENRSILGYDNYDKNNAYGFEMSSNYRFTKC